MAQIDPRYYQLPKPKAQKPHLTVDTSGPSKPKNQPLSLEIDNTDNYQSPSYTTSPMSTVAEQLVSASSTPFTPTFSAEAIEVVLSHHSSPQNFTPPAGTPRDPAFRLTTPMVQSIKTAPSIPSNGENAVGRTMLEWVYDVVSEKVGGWRIKSTDHRVDHHVPGKRYRRRDEV